MKTPVKITLFALGLLVFLIFIYYSMVVYSARLQTEKIVDSAFETYGTELQVNDLSEEQLDILLKIEDPNFYTHKGVDLTTDGAGITTITQGMVKYLYFEHFKQGIAKIKQTLIARFALDAKVSKGEQLLLFINSAYLGNVDGQEIRGFANAAKIYYGKNFKDLTTDEYIEIIAMLIGPNKYNPLTDKENLNQRVERIQKFLNGECKPLRNGDVFYEDCK